MAFFQIENLFWVGFVAAAAVLVFAGAQVYRLLKLPEGQELGEFSRAVRKGTLAFLKRQSMAAVPLFLLVLLLLFGLRLLGVIDDPNLPLAFLSGGVCAAAAGLLALALSVLANARTAAAVEGGVHSGFNAAFTAASAAAFAGVALALTEVLTWFHILRHALGYDPVRLVNTMVLFGAGAAYAAFLSRLGGGIFAKAADLSAGPPSGSEGEAMEVRRGPGAIADCVGDNVINAAGTSADLYSGYVLALLAAMCAAVHAFENDGILWNALLYPVAVAAIGAVCSLVACLLVKAGENADERALLALLRKGAWAAAFLTGAISAPISYLLTGTWGPCAAVFIGLLAGLAVEHLAGRASSNLYQSVRRLAGSAEGGVSAELAGGAGVGLRSASSTLLVLILAIAASFLVTGGQLDAAYETLYSHALIHGLYGIALAGVGAMSTLGYTLSAALLAPIADNADCAAKVAGLDRTLLGRAAILNALGGSLAHIGRSLSAGVSVLAVPMLVWVYTIAVKVRSGALSFAITSPALIAGGFVGVILVSLFVSLLFSGLQSCAQPMAAELRRQIREANRQGGAAVPDYTSCVDLCARSAAIRTLAPGLFAVAVPFGTAVFLGPEGIAGFLLAAALLGLSGALFLSGMGSALDCARQRVETERRGGSEARRTAVISDRLGDLFKDMIGPSLGLLVRLCFTLSLFLATLAAEYNLLSLPG